VSNVASSLREECKLQVYVNEILRKIFGIYKDEPSNLIITPGEAS
jgi:hypothetical protein